MSTSNRVHHCLLKQIVFTVHFRRVVWCNPILHIGLFLCGESNVSTKANDSLIYSLSSFVDQDKDTDQDIIMFNGRPNQDNDIESGRPIFRLNTDSYDSNDIEPIPDLKIGNGDASNNNNHNHNPEANVALTAESISSVNVSASTDHNVINRMTTLEYFWRRHVRSRTNNARVHEMLDRILLVFLFLANLVEQPLMYVLGNTQQTNKHKQSKSLQTPVTRGSVKTGLGVIAYRISQGRNPKKNPILCFHADSRSSDEYVELLPLLADTGRRVVALDMPGYGWSDNPQKSCSIDDIADAFLKVADSMLIEQFVCVGSSMGTLISTSLASRYPNRVRGCVHVNLLYNPAIINGRPNNSINCDVPTGPGNLIYKDDGSHLLDLHIKRKFLDPDLNLRCIQSDLTHIVNLRARILDGVTMEDATQFDLESAARKMRCPTLCVGGESALASLDARGLFGTQRFDTACRMLPHCEVKTLTGPRSTIYMINQAPKELTSLCAGFLEKYNL